MKNRILSLLLTLSLLLSALAGCGTEEGADGQSANSPVRPVREEITLDYSDFVMPEATETLTVYSTAMLGIVMTPAVKRFRELYPEVTVDYQTLSDDEFNLRVETEIPAGAGPDVFFAYSLPDMYKTIEAGIFEDLNPYMQNDPDFHEEDFYDVLDVGLLNGVRGILPVEIALPILKTTEEALQDAGITREELRTWDGFMAAASRYRKQYPNNPILSSGRDSGHFSDMIKNSGMDFIDYRNRVPAVDRERLKQLCEFCALDYAEGASDYLVDEGWYMGGGAPVWRKALFNNTEDSVTMLSMDRYHFEKESEEGELLIFEAVPDIYDGVTASLVSFAGIPKSSPNKLNAWRLITVMLSDDIQGGSDSKLWNASYLRIGFPVRRESMERQIREKVREFYSGGAPEYPEYEDEIARDIADISELYGRMAGCSAVQSNVVRYLWQNMKPFLKGTQSFDKCYEKLYGELELYASE